MPSLSKGRSIKLNWQRRLSEAKLVFKFSGVLCHLCYYMAPTLSSTSLLKVNIPYRVHKSTKKLRQIYSSMWEFVSMFSFRNYVHIMMKSETYPTVGLLFRLTHNHKDGRIT
jgi:hypothetical protein